MVEITVKKNGPYVISGPILNRLIGGPLALRASDATLNYGDPVLASLVGWHSGNWHW